MNTTADPHSDQRRNVWRTALISIALLGLLALSLSSALDRAARDQGDRQLTQALTTYAVARTLNGIISVAQGTEIAVQPVGVGVTLTPGEILDPLNDLVERFSWLVLLACASIGTQLLLSEIFANAWMTGVLGGAVAVLLVLLWLPRRPAGASQFMRLCAALIFLRFFAAVVLLSSGWISEALLRDRQDAAVAVLSNLSASLDETPVAAGPPAVNLPTLLERLQAMIESGQQSLDLKKTLDDLRRRAESAIGELINLIVVFTVETLVLPLVALLLAWGTLKWFWRTLNDPG